MSKLTKRQAAAHADAEKLLAKDVLTEDEKDFVRANWQESALHINSVAGAFFTPAGLARDTILEVDPRGRVIDLCAGIGTLASEVWDKARWHDEKPEIVCVELNPEYARVGKKLLPEATWIVDSIFALPNLGHFDTAISNPPFGNIARDGEKLRYTGSKFEFHVMDLASDLADFGVFIIPQQSAGFQYSGRQTYERNESRDYEKFKQQTGIVLEAGCGVDTSIYLKDWHGVSPMVEIVTAEFMDLRPGAAVTELPFVDALDFGDWEVSA